MLGQMAAPGQGQWQTGEKHDSLHKVSDILWVRSKIPLTNVSVVNKTITSAG